MRRDPTDVPFRSGLELDQVDADHPRHRPWESSSTHSPMTVGQLARRTGLTPRSIRRFEDLGLIYSIGRSRANYRLFDESALWCVEVVRNLRALGLTVREIGQLAAFYLDRQDESVGPLLAEQLATVRRRIDGRAAELDRVRDRLDAFEHSHAAALADARPISSWAGDPRRTADRA